MGKFKDLTGEIINNWKIIEFKGLDKNKHSLWLIECQCENKTRKIKDTSYINKHKSCRKCSSKKRINNLYGKRFNNIVVISQPIYKNNRIYYECECDCGNIILRRSDDIKNIISCGCHLQTKDNESRSRIYTIWYGMNYRCSENAKGKDKRNYYDRGIRVCDEWKDKNIGYQNFRNWAFSNGYKENLTIERIDVNKNYCPENCTWIDMESQAKNKTNTVKIKYKNNEYKACNLQNEKISYATLKNRMNNKVEEEKLFRELATNNTSGITGVSKTSNGKKWRAYITIKKARKHLGTFNTFEEAIKARKEAEEKYYKNENVIGTITKRIKE